MTRAAIDLEWVKDQIYELHFAIQKGVFDKDSEPLFKAKLETLELVKSQCQDLTGFTIYNSLEMEQQSDRMDKLGVPDNSFFEQRVNAILLEVENKDKW